MAITDFLGPPSSSTGLNSAMMKLALKRPPLSITKSQEALNPNLGYNIPNTGLFGTPGSLPTNPGPPDPPILPGANLPNNAFSPQGPNVQVNWHGTGSAPYWNQPSSGGTTQPAPNTGPSGINFGPGGALRGGNNGPQGSVYGIDPNTGNPIYNATGSPKPGFFDSKTGKFVETLGSTALNMWVPGLGFVSKAIFDAVRRNQARNNTGTDLSHSRPAGGATGGAGVTPGNPGGSSGLLSPLQYSQQTFGGLTPTGYRDPSGSAVNGTSAASNAFQMWQASMSGAPNNMGTTTDTGHTIFYNPGTTRRGYADPESDGIITSTPSNNVVQALAAWKARQNMSHRGG
jgi:hypothetical protein